ncbi:hypothetical protein [Morganella morganii IS15]|nr:hypothetical protein [Morganella morganii IS15]
MKKVHSTPLITTIVGGLVLAYLLGMLAQRLKISPLVVIWRRVC